MNQTSNRIAPVVLTREDRRAHLRADMKTRYLVFLVLGALATGIGSGWAILGERPPFGAINIGPWQSFPRIGSSDVDPYSRAMLARGPHLPLAQGEGVQLFASADSRGAALQARCSYLISGTTLPSRGWTLTLASDANLVVTGKNAAALSDADLMTDETGRLRITASAAVASGTWLKLPDAGRFGLILRFFDTPASASLGQLGPEALPGIERLSCKDEN